MNAFVVTVAQEVERVVQKGMKMLVVQIPFVVVSLGKALKPNVAVSTLQSSSHWWVNERSL